MIIAFQQIAMLHARPLNLIPGIQETTKIVRSNLRIEQAVPSFAIVQLNLSVASRHAMYRSWLYLSASVHRKQWHLRLAHLADLLDQVTITLVSLASFKSDECKTYLTGRWSLSCSLHRIPTTFSLPFEWSSRCSVINCLPISLLHP